MIVFSERSLYRHIAEFLEYYHWSRTHLALMKDTPSHGRSNRWNPDESCRFR
jgi:hypothetical protein